MLAEWLADLRHGGDEDQVEEELQPCDLPRRIGAGDESQLGRPDESFHLLSTPGQLAIPFAMFERTSCSHIFCTRFE